MSKEMKKLKYDDFLKSIVNHEYHNIDIESDLQKNTVKIILTRGEWIIENNSRNYQNKDYYYDFDIEEIVDLILDLLYEKEQETTNEILNEIHDLLKRLEK